ncbi:alpha/beta fold hydrolase [Microbacterium album]|uniref:Esterase n=1 Tax=Microbacterium album TaxID=2053191 RepID=A0A917IE84_9MICO|nr:alpha/beta hydrolase [Microbacterium album]GGH35047.1 esterase [Microbacterium album]
MSDIILVPGLWLDASSWSDVVGPLERAGHRALPLTLPGVGAPAAESADVGMDQWVDAVVAEIDGRHGPAVVVGHSGGGNVAWAAADRRPEAVSRVVLVDTVPPPNGQIISEFPVVDGVVPFPGWDAFEPDDIADLDEDTRARVAATARSVPARVPTDPLTLHDERRHGVPVTLLMGQADETALRGMIAHWPEWAAELEAIERLDVVRLGSGHWPQFSRPAALAQAIAAAIA